jgi:aminoglycoside phosphotransferase (APT) family kinase protein
VQSIRDFLARAGLIDPGETPHFEPLGGGVSSDIWLVLARSRNMCVKRALPQLRVAAEWHADVSRNMTEVRWLTQVGKLNPDLVPAVLASDPVLGAFAMEYLPPDRFEIWKSQLARGVVIPETASTIGRQLARIHAAFATSAAARTEFDTGASFHALRIEPYLLATARVHPDLAAVMESLAERTRQSAVTVVHGDISPKNILMGVRGPVFLDAECAWFGDPAFDLAFCLNHLLLKTLWVPSAERELLQSFDGMADGYLRGVDWEQRAGVERRAAHLLPALLLARVDGKSPVEYVTDDAAKNIVRRVARSLLLQSVDRLEDVRRAWEARAPRRPASGARGGDRIEKVIGRRVWDSRGRPTVEAASRRQVRPPGSTRRSIFATAVKCSADSASTAPSAMSRKKSRAR